MASNRKLPRDLGLRSSSFVAADDLPTTITPRVIANIEAAQKRGKTDFCLRDTPDPIVIFNLDQGLEGVVEKFLKKGRNIIVAGMPGTGGRDPKTGKKRFPHYHFGRPVPDPGQVRKADAYLQRVSKQALPIWEQFIRDYMEALHSNARTLVIDTATALFSLAKFAYVGMDKYTTADDPYGQKSGGMKSLFQGLVADGLDYDKNVLWISRIKEEWKGGQPSGKFTNDGYTQLRYEVQTTIRLDVKRGESVAEVLDCRIDRKMNGEMWEGDEVSFRTIMAEICGNDPEEWV